MVLTGANSATGLRSMPARYVFLDEVSERKYAAWPPHIRKVFEAARTVRTGKESFELIAGDA